MVTASDARGEGLLPDLVSLRKSVQKRSRYAGALPAELEALAELRAAVEQLDAVRASVEFGQSESGFAEIHIEASATVELQCQRCLQACRQQLQAKAELSVLKSDEEARQRLSELEPLVLEQDEIDLHSLVMQELSLVLPTVALHEGADRAACDEAVAASLAAGQVAKVVSVSRAGQPEAAADRDPSADVGVDGPEKVRPFAGLADMLASSKGEVGKDGDASA